MSLKSSENNRAGPDATFIAQSFNDLLPERWLTTALLLFSTLFFGMHTKKEYDYPTVARLAAMSVI